MSIDLGELNLFIKMISEEYKLTNEELFTLSSRMMADDEEFKKVWKSYKNKTSIGAGGVDQFKHILFELIR